MDLIKPVPLQYIKGISYSNTILMFKFFTKLYAHMSLLSWVSPTHSPSVMVLLFYLNMTTRSQINLFYLHILTIISNLRFVSQPNIFGMFFKKYQYRHAAGEMMLLKNINFILSKLNHLLFHFEMVFSYFLIFFSFFGYYKTLFSRNSIIR